jgi:L-alanine-DL-glutamate epimerase-like enolase superfamily enzyme
MKIVDVKAYPIRIENNPSESSSSDKGKEQDSDQSFGGESDRPPIKDLGDHYIDKTNYTSIYSKFHQTTVVKVETSDGIIGWGESQSPVSPNTTATIIKDLVNPLTINADIFDVEAIWNKNFTAMKERGHYTGFYIDAISGVDIAIWDAIGKTLKLPTHKLLGGRHRDSIKLYNGIGGRDPKKVADMALSSIAKGYKAVKLHLRENMEGTIEIVSEVRKAIGDDIDLMLDVHMMFNTHEAIRLGRQLEKFNVYWLEAPSDPNDIPGQIKICQALDIPIANGEWTRTKFEMREIFEKRAYDISMPDIARTGLTGAKQIASIADLYNIPVAPHVGGGGILSVAATVQFSIATPNFLIMEHSEQGNKMKSQYLSHPFEAENGEFTATDKPGLGIEIDENALQSFIAKPSL